MPQRLPVIASLSPLLASSSRSTLKSRSFCHATLRHVRQPPYKNTLRSAHSPVFTSRPPDIVNRYSSARQVSTSHAARKHRVFVALGSNVGDRLKYIEDACNALDARSDVRVCRTSSLWETKAMYVTDQDDFLNGVCEIETSLDPIALLDMLQSIERDLQRKKLVEKGPRTIDLDILLYDDLSMTSERLTIPHALMLERAFVLQPLCQLMPDHKPPGASATYSDHLAQLDQSSLAPSTVTPLASLQDGIRALLPERRTRIMSVLNVTPDSFSDGGQHSVADLKALEATIRSHIAGGATIIDVGGQSTRPKADDVGADEEVARVVPAVRLIKSLTDATAAAARPVISVDTYRASVARAAVEAGADIVNDVSAGTLDAAMLQTVAELGCTYMAMHMRGNPSTMNNTANTSYPHGLLETVGKELAARIAAAEEAGVRRWRMVVDPGVGFAKGGAQNAELLRGMGELRATTALHGLPWMVGASRKRFVGQATGVERASERTWGTAACVTAAIQGGADVVRVHDVGEMAQVAAMADAIWRGWPCA